MRRSLLTFAAFAAFGSAALFPQAPAPKSPAAAPAMSHAAHGTSGHAADVVKDEFTQFGIYETTAPHPKPTAAVTTRLPLELRRGDRIVFIGNTLFERAAQYPHFEALLHLAHPQHELVVRTLAWSADEPGLMPRPKNFGDIHQHLTVQQADVIFAAFGFNESFGGAEKLPAFRARLATFLRTLKTSAYNGRTAPRIVLVSPIANENVRGLHGAPIPAADRNHANLALYTRAMAEVAAAEEIGFADVLAPTQAAFADPATDFTFNGVHLEDHGYALFADALFRATFHRAPPAAAGTALGAELRTAVADKNTQFFRRYRPLNTFYYTGDRRATYGYLDFLPAMRNFDFMVANRDRRVWQIAAGRRFGPEKVDDSNLPAMPSPLANRAANEWLSPKAEYAAFKIDPRFEVNLFASEEQFPEIANPIQIRFDARGRLWVSCSSAYPHLYPGQEPRDRLVILEDTDGDGRADKSTVFADHLHVPLSFELGDGGVYVSEQPHLTFLKDTDGDGRADFRRELFTGFGTEDSHHALHDLVWTPDGDLLFRESIFHNTQVETAYGPIRAANSSWFRLRTDTQRLSAFGAYPNTNPWGVAFDAWGRHMASHPIFANAFHATNPPYPEQHPAGTGLPAYSGTCGHDFIDFDFWPAELRGGFLKARYKPTNRIEMHQWLERDDHFEEKYLGDVIFSTNLSFIPTDLVMSPRGEAFVCDWYNPVKGHMQYSLRDERRDRTSGRIWRIVPKGAQLAAFPRLDGAPVAALLEVLKSPHYRQRYLARRELRLHAPATVKPVLDRWVATLDAKHPDFRRHQLEAVWAYRIIGATNVPLLLDLLRCDNHHARAAATQQLRYWAADLPEVATHLRDRALDTNGLVRLEAVIAASYIGTPAALEAIAGSLDRPAGAHLRYAMRTALGSEALARHWKNDATSAPATVRAAAGKFVADFDRAGQQTRKATKADATASNFDRQLDVANVTISTVRERMLFDVTQFTVKAGQPVKLVFNNTDATPHNLVIVAPGAADEVGMAGNEMAKDPNGIKQHFVPKTDKVLFFTPLLEAEGTTTLRFRAPRTPGEYPYLCTFPGHWIMMRGVMKVTP